MDRITEKHLEAVVARINRATNSPPEPYVREGDKFVAQIGCYHLSHAYGGVALHRMGNDSGGVADIFGGHVPKRALAEKMYAFLKGIEAAQEVAA